jgi:hypothetical protein
MKTQYLKILFLVILSIVALGIAAPYGPIAQIPNFTKVDESYLDIVRNHEFYLGFVLELTGLTGTGIAKKNCKKLTGTGIAKKNC